MNKIEGWKWRELLTSGVNNLSNNVDRINALNVFPVPDGDTGSNMNATAQKALEEISTLDSNNIGEISSKFARGMLLGARGNSGVILSQIFKGISISFENKETIDIFDLVDAFSMAKDIAYKSVMKPVEGTILTVIRETSEVLNEKITKSTPIKEFFKVALDASKESLKKTPDLLPVLKEVGVVDSGADGLVMVLEGMQSAINGKIMKANEVQVRVTKHAFESIGEEHGGEYGYCTEFIVEIEKPKSFDQERFEKALKNIGGRSTVVVRDSDILKVHVHLDLPGKALNLAQKFGEFLNIKVDNMTLQANASKKLSDNSKASADGKVAVISCNVGQGIIKDMNSFGTNFIIEGGQSMNPSAQDFLEALESLSQNEIIILPNNSNILLVAQQVAQTSNKNVVIIPSKTQMQGLVAMMHFDSESDLASNEKEMLEAIANVDTVQVTIAVRDTTIEGIKVKKDEFLSIANNKILGTNVSKIEAALKSLKSLINDDTEIVTIYYGEDATEVEAQDIANELENNFDIEVEIKNGQQPIYHFLIAVE